ncbi:MAG: NAD(P)H-dependent oxidoreductase subunit E [Anaerolineae bacterium]|nr:NAD(P)H-dependent oxidoreductase subunit E [Anaerolineae bacterium]MDK1081158.1 NAD(P)H-dependent oxidoreductase subunit E [Anaerolineae bacterium]
MLAEKYPEEVKQILGRYPPEQKRSAVMPLLFMAQREEGFVNKEAKHEIASMLDISETEVASIIGFYTLYHAKKEGKYRFQVCNDLPCALRGADKFLEGLCDKLGVQVGETTNDGFVTIETVMCLAACDKVPMFQTQSPNGIKYYENMTIDKTMELIEVLKMADKEVK